MMQETITFAVPAKSMPALRDLTREEGLSLSELAEKALKEYLFLRQFRSLRQGMMTQAQFQGINTDQDVFDRVS